MALMQNHIGPGDHVLEIGIGSGFTANYLRSKGVKVTTMDIDERKKPDIVANMVTYDWDDSEYDHLLASKVFEHMPFKEFEKILSDMNSVVKNNIFFSVPIAEHVLLSLQASLPLFGQKSLKRALPRRNVSTEYHFGELGPFNAPVKSRVSVFNDHQFTVKYKKKKLGRFFINAKTSASYRVFFTG